MVFIIHNYFNSKGRLPTVPKTVGTSQTVGQLIHHCNEWCRVARYPSRQCFMSHVSSRMQLENIFRSRFNLVPKQTGYNADWMSTEKYQFIVWVLKTWVMLSAYFFAACKYFVDFCVILSCIFSSEIGSGIVL